MKLRNLLARYKFYLLMLAFVPVISSCSDYNKILRSSNYDEKYKAAMAYYNKEDYVKALPLFEELIPITRGTERGEKVYYHFCQTHYNIGDYYLAGYYFKNFNKTYPYSQFAEEASFMSAICIFKTSPRYELDQTQTYEALDALQLHLNKYPETTLKDTCNYLMDKLTAKLEKKDYEGAKQYHRMESYKAASIAFTNFINKYPNTAHKEEILYLIVKSNYLLAMNSIEDKKLERLENTINSYHKFVDVYPESRHLKDAEFFFKNVLKELERQKTEKKGQQKNKKQQEEL